MHFDADLSLLRAACGRIARVAARAGVRGSTLRLATVVALVLALEGGAALATLDPSGIIRETTGVPAGPPVPVNAGDLFDVATPALSVPSAPGSFAVVTGP